MKRTLTDRRQEMREWREWLESRLQYAWYRLLGTFSGQHCFAADLVAALERGEGATTFTWWWDDTDGAADDGDCSLAGLMEDIHHTVRRAPVPFGADEFFLRLAVYGPRPEDQNGFEDTPEGRDLLHFESHWLDRRDDWLHGNGRQWLREFLEKNEPSPQAPLVAVGVLPIGGAIAALLREGRWRPASPWLR
jgi:hypothetical protein